MSRLVVMMVLLLAGNLLSAQGFPEAQKQPRMKEQKANHKRYAKTAKRRHVKRGTVYFQPGNFGTQQTPICLLADKRSLPLMG